MIYCEHLLTLLYIYIYIFAMQVVINQISSVWAPLITLKYFFESYTILRLILLMIWLPETSGY